MSHSRIPLVLKFAGGLSLAFLAAFAAGFFVLLLWNWLMPAIFGLPVISYWQAWGLLILSHLLFKAGHGHSLSSGYRHDTFRKHWKDHLRTRFHETDSGEGADPV